MGAKLGRAPVKKRNYDGPANMKHKKIHDTHPIKILKPNSFPQYVNRMTRFKLIFPRA